MAMTESDYLTEISNKYLERADHMLTAAQLALDHDDYVTAVNRAYYTIFYASNALLASRGLERSKHTGVLALFRQLFVKPGLIELEFSDDYGAVMEDRAEGDYNIEADLEAEIAEMDVARARRFVARIKKAIAASEKPL